MDKSVLILLVTVFSFSTVCSESLLLLLAGEPDELLDLPDTEGDSILQCPDLGLGPYPVADGIVFGAFGSSREVGGDVEVLVCGGISYGVTGGITISGECYGVRGSKPQKNMRGSPTDEKDLKQVNWEERASLLWPVAQTGSAKFGSFEEGEFLWVIGGVTGAANTPLSKSQIYDFNAEVWIEGPELPMPLVFPCLVKLNSTHTLVTGGEQAGSGRTWVYDWGEEGGWTELAPMVGGERFSHGCAVMGDGKVVVAGGYRGINTPEATDLSTAEVFDPVSLTWTETGSLPEPLDGSVLMAVEKGPWAGQVLHLGGHQPDSITGGDMITFDAVHRYTAEGAWELVYTMASPRAHFVALNLPIHCD